MVQLCKDALMPQNLKVHSRPQPQSPRYSHRATVAAPRNKLRYVPYRAIPTRADARHFTVISPPRCFATVLPPCVRAPRRATCRTCRAAGSYYCSGIVEIRKEEGEEDRREVSLVVPLFGNDDN